MFWVLLYGVCFERSAVAIEEVVKYGLIAIVIMMLHNWDFVMVFY